MNLLKTNLKKLPLWLICFALVVMVWAFRLVSLNYTGINTVQGNVGFVSDEVAQQNILWYWQHGYHERATTGDDSFFIKFPLYFVINNLPISPLRQLLLTSFILLMGTAFLTMWALDKLYAYMIRSPLKAKISILLSGGFLAAIPASSFYLLAFPNSRNIELGLFLVLLVALYQWLYDSEAYMHHKRLKLTTIVVISAVLVANDPMILYDFALPTLLLSGLFALFSLKEPAKYLRLMVFSFSSIAVSYAVRMLLRLVLPIKFYAHKSDIATFDQVLANIRAFITDGINIFGINVLGKSPTAPSTLLAVACLIIFISSLAGLTFAVIKNKERFYSIFILVIFLWSLVVFLSSTFLIAGDDRLIGRYIMLMYPIELLGLGLAVGALLKRQIVVLGIVVAACLTLTILQSGVNLAHNYKNQPNKFDTQDIDQIKGLGLIKGYAFYDKAVKDTFLSDHVLNISSVSCSRQDLSLYRFPLLNEVSTIKQKADQSFYLYNPSRVTDCSAEELSKQLGNAKEVITANNGSFIAIYDYDIGPKVKP